MNFMAKAAQEFVMQVVLISALLLTTITMSLEPAYQTVIVRTAEGTRDSVMAIQPPPEDTLVVADYEEPERETRYYPRL